jgi:hypothetical protein
MQRDVARLTLEASEFHGRFSLRKIPIGFALRENVSVRTGQCIADECANNNDTVKAAELTLQLVIVAESRAAAEWAPGE